MERVREIHFFEHPQMDFEIRAGLGGTYYGSTDAGEILGTAESIEEMACPAAGTRAPGTRIALRP